MEKRLTSLMLIFTLFVVMSVAWVEAAPKEKPEKPKQLKVRTVRDLDFGYLHVGQSAITLDPVTPNWGMIPGELQIMGTPLLPIQMELPVDLLLTNGNSTISVYNFTSNWTDQQGVLDEFGETTIRIGATVGPIPTSATAGKYKGRCTVTVYYQY